MDKKEKKFHEDAKKGLESIKEHKKRLEEYEKKKEKEKED